MIGVNGYSKVRFETRPLWADSWDKAGDDQGVFGTLRAFFDWQGRFFLGERPMSFAGPLAKAELCQRLSSSIVPMPGWRVHVPFEYGRRIAKVRGLVTDDALFLLPPRSGVFGNFFGLNTLFLFAGKVTEAPKGVEITGRYQVVSLFRVFCLLWLTGVWIGVALSFGVLVWSLMVGVLVWSLMVADYERLFRSLIVGGGCFALLGIFYFLFKIVTWGARPSQEALHAFLVGLAAAKPAPESDARKPG